MINIGIVSIIIIVINFAVSYKGFNDGIFFEKYKFQVDRILIHKEYYRLITSGFLHVDWMHLIFNMISLYAFSELLEVNAGIINFLIIYFCSLIAGDLFALLLHKNHGDYNSVGASGAVCGVIFASIALFPGLGIGFFILPISIPSWLYALLYIIYSIYGVKSNRDNIGHEAHLGGAVIGMLIAVILFPHSLTENYVPIAIVLIPCIIFIYIIITKPYILYIDNYFFKTHKKYYSIDHKYNEQKVNQQQEIDKLLDKISKKGIKSLSKNEKQKLEEYSNKR
ncbi:rhomboid family protein [Flavobacterium reichenbachii]|uniref:Rhomboid family protein n=1 Tax=Flavobacterium reichenbachii TaxID=362418 RepID=A0A085ZL03_9FLAO|nr:rhomboid family intramembrane serine protease [Flavobacterium reichenbachii]KFF05117.1 rhomboid family protein [Flavobacterium reichenbachii]OXB16213.1 rhomboid family intramembrane serine protease [Flavobacterium reichenbachii]